MRVVLLLMRRVGLFLGISRMVMVMVWVLHRHEGVLHRPPLLAVPTVADESCGSVHGATAGSLGGGGNAGMTSSMYRRTHSWQACV
jgi:hypothetical protein